MSSKINEIRLRSLTKLEMMMQDKFGKSPVMETEKGFSLLRTDTIQLWAWLQGHDPLDELLLKSISEDISYRIRETTDNAANYMHHCKRSKLKTSDLNKAFQMSNIDKTFGYSNKEPFTYNRVETAESDDNDSIPRMTLFELNEKFIELKLVEEDQTRSKLVPKTASYKNVYGQWLIVNGNYLISDSKLSDDNYSFNLDDGSCYSNADDLMSENEMSLSRLDDAYREYFEMITAVLLSSNVETPDEAAENERMYLVILNDLKTNPKLQSILPYMINFVYQTIHTLSSAKNNSTVLASKANLEFLHRCIDALKHMILNPSLFLAPKGFFAKILSCLLFCTLQSAVISSKVLDDGLILRESASFVMVMFLRLYQRFALNTIKFLIRSFFTPNFSADKSVESLNCHTIYGILTTLVNFGGQMIHDYRDKLADLHKKLLTNDNRTLVETLTLQQILKCFVFYFKWIIKKHKFSPRDPNYSYEKIAALYHEFADMYGEAFTNQVAHLAISQIKATKDQKHMYTRAQSFKIVTKIVKISVDPVGQGRLLDEWFDEYPARIGHASKHPRSVRLNYGFQQQVTNSKTSSNEQQGNQNGFQLFQLLEQVNQTERVLLKRKLVTLDGAKRASGLVGQCLIHSFL